MFVSIPVGHVLDVVELAQSRHKEKVVEDLDPSTVSDTFTPALMHFNHLLKFFMVKFFIALTSDQEFLILLNLSLKSFFCTDRFLEHTQEIN